MLIACMCIREGTKSLIFHMTFLHTDVVSITDHSHTFFVWGSRGITLKNRHQIYYVKSIGIKVMTQQEHMTISYLLCMCMFTCTKICCVFVLRVIKLHNIIIDVCVMCAYSMIILWYLSILLVEVSTVEICSSLQPSGYSIFRS